MKNNIILLYTDSEAYFDHCSALAERLHIHFTSDKEELSSLTQPSPSSNTDSDTLTKAKQLYLKYDSNGLSLTDGSNELRGDFSENLKRLKQNNLQRELLVKAARLKGLDHTPLLLDATAGMGEDSLLLAASGFNVMLFEYDPVIAALLEDTLRRGLLIPELCDIVSRMELHTDNSIDAMKSLESSPDVILLDPMFPARTKSSLVKKKFQLLQQLEPPCSDANLLLDAAIKARPHKIIIKRPVKGPFLGDIKPDFSLSGKAIRYDCILPETRKF